MPGEIALEQLQNAIKTRLNLKEQPLNNHYELAAYLYDELTESTNERTMGRADVLFRFLQLMGENRPQGVDDYLKQLDPNDERSIVHQLVDLVIVGDEEGYETYNRARKEVDVGSQYMERDVATGMLPTFLDNWIKLEGKLISIAQLKRGKYTGPLSPSLLRELQIFSHVDDLTEVETLRGLRNQIMYGTDPSKSEMVVAEKEISRLLNKLEGQYSIAPRPSPRRSSVRLRRGLRQS